MRRILPKKLARRAEPHLIRVLDAATAPLVRDVVVVSGFWRSGSTWLQQQVGQALHAKTVFEPWSPSAGNLWEDVLRDEDIAYRQAYLPLSASGIGRSAQRRAAAALRGRASNEFMRLVRAGVRESLRPRVVVKFVRLGFVMDVFLADHPGPCLHLRRHPAATYASFRRLAWGWSFREVELRRLYGSSDLSAEPEAEELRRVLLAHDGGELDRIAALWALSESVAQRSIDSGATVGLVYEDLLGNGELLDAALRRIGREPSPRRIDRDSPVTSPGRRGATAEQRRASYLEELSAEEIARLRAITTELFPGSRELYWDATAPRGGVR